jgi:predicted secreted protein
MSVVSGIVLYAVIWFLVLFIMLPIRLETQGDKGDVVPGTPESAPAHFDFGKKARLVTLVAAIVWAVVAGVIFSGVITVEDLDFFGRMSPRDGGTGE